jgi:hypothetical protein
MNNINHQANDILSVFFRLSLFAPIFVLFVDLITMPATQDAYTYLLLLIACTSSLVFSCLYSMFKIASNRTTRISWNHVDEKLIFKTKIKIYAVLSLTLLIILLLF